MSDAPTMVQWESIHAVQDEITRWADEQFPGRTDHQTIFKLMVHEIPELMTHKKEKGTDDIGTELADCFILLMDLASMWEVDLVGAIRSKMLINYQRIWERDPHGIMQHVPKDKYPAVARAQAALSTMGGYSCPNCVGAPCRTLTAEELTELRVQWGNQSLCPYDSVCLKCNQAFDSNVPF